MTIEEMIKELEKYPADMQIRVQQFLVDVEEGEEYPADLSPTLKLYDKFGKRYVLILGK